MNFSSRIVIKPHPRSIRSFSFVPPRSKSDQQSSSSFLFQEAEREELEKLKPREARKRADGPEETNPFKRATRISNETVEDEGWQGTELQSALVRRLIEDSAPKEMKLKKKPAPELSKLPNILFDTAASPSTTAPSATPLEPWEYKFKAPDNFKEIPISLGSSPDFTIRKRPELSSLRAARARDDSLDYETGFGTAMRGRVYVPDDDAEAGDIDEISTANRNTGLGGGGMRAWTGIVDEKIENARKAGAFKNVKGRYKPMEKDGYESNPFVSREDFLINRMIKGQGASPPWIEAQKEIVSATSDFRVLLRDSWCRRAIRMKSLNTITNSTLISIQDGWRDPEWEQRERAFHVLSMKNLNSLLSKYNYLAPYSVRKPRILLETELAACFRDSVSTIVAELKKRKDGFVEPLPAKKLHGERIAKTEFDGKEKKVVEQSAWKAFTSAVGEVFSRPPQL